MIEIRSHEPYTNVIILTLNRYYPIGQLVTSRSNAMYSLTIGPFVSTLKWI